DVADGGIAGHLPDDLQVHGDEERPGAHTRRGGGSFASRMTSANHDDVISKVVAPHRRPHLPMQNLEKIWSNTSSVVTSPTIAPSSSSANLRSSASVSPPSSASNFPRADS